jgi:adenine-specific DNA-methyltransferase
MSQKYEKLKTLLKELFQLDQPDLDFGLYRVMHAKSAEVSQFLDKDLLPQVQAAFGQYRTADRVEIEKELGKVVAGIEAAGMNPDDSPKVKDLRKRLKNDAVDVGALESEVYDQLFGFFRRYYSEGDFLAKRVYRPGVYAIPYEGEEVTLHWSNKDQYYIKTSEYLRDYAFRLRLDDNKKPMRVHFRLADAAEGEHGNVKTAEGKDRVFILTAPGESGRDFIAEEVGEQGRDLVIRFEYRPATLADWPEDARAGKSKPPAQKDLTVLAATRVLAVTDAAMGPWIADLGKPHVTASGEKVDYTRLEAHLKRYTARNTFDYFIHKDLGTFLRRELDFYIKNEVMHLDDVENETAPRVDQYLSKIKVIRKIAGKLIDFLAQLEDFQKKLWLKKKFVVETQYCITLDRIPEEFYPEIAANEEQREEWVKLFAIDEISGDLTAPRYSTPLTVEFLQANKGLPVDTVWFSSQFTEAVLNSQSDLDASLCGIVVSSEATQSSRLLRRWLSARIGVLLADPPYNTGSDGFPYKDSYQHSSWLTMSSDFLEIMKAVMRPDALCACFIDDHEMYRLGLLMNEVFGEAQRAACAPWKSEASGGKEKTGLRTGHEYILIYHNGDGTCIAQTEISTGDLDREDKWGKYRKGRELRKWGGASSRADRPGQWFQLPAPDGSKVFPMKNDGSEGHWRWGKENKAIKKALITPEVFHWEKCTYDRGVSVDGTTERWVPFEKIRDVKKSVGWSTWLDGVGTNADATRELKAMFGEKPFETPKPSSIYRWLISLHNDDETYVVDFFAGSGTAAQAVIDLNSEDGSNRRFVVGDIGGSVHDVVWPRVKKAGYSRSWKDGKPANRDDGCSLLCKWVILESYEDALNNLVAGRTDKQQLLLGDAEAQGADGLREQYILRYMLDVETRGSQSLLNVQAFTDPTAYKLKVKRPGSDESREVNVDLLETFNWLIGLTVKHVAAPQSFSAAFERDSEKRLRVRGRIKQNYDGPYWFRTVTGTSPDGRNTLVIWRKLGGAPEQDNLVLDEWFTKQGYSAKDSEFDLIYVNGGNNLENLKTPDDLWKVRLIEEDFHRLMFATEGA